MTPEAQTAQAIKFIAALLVAIVVAAALVLYGLHVHRSSAAADTRQAAQECQVDPLAQNCP